MTTTYTGYYHQDGNDPETLATGMTQPEAVAWLKEKAAECGQPVQGDHVNESEESGCGYYAIDPE